MRIVQLMASPFFGGPERQMLGLAKRLPPECETTFLTFREGGKCQALLDEVAAAGLQGETLEHNFPRVSRCVAEIGERLRALKADIVCCSGYKPDILGWRAARRVGLPVVIVSHGWTSATWKVRAYEKLDRWVHRQVDAVVGVSEAQTAKLRAAGVAPERIETIANAVDDAAFAPPDETYRARLTAMFASPPKAIVGAAGRLSPEKGFDQLVEAADALCRDRADVGVVVFGDGPMRGALERTIAERRLRGRVVLAGFASDVGKFLPHFDVGVIPSFTEGLPVVLLEMLAAGRPVVASAVGGIPEVVIENRTGLLVGAGQPMDLARKIERILDDPDFGRRLGETGKATVRERFSAKTQAERYFELFRRLTRTTSAVAG